MKSAIEKFRKPDRTPSEIEELKNKQKNKLAPKKRFGQNFLVNSSMQFRIVDEVKNMVNEYDPNWILEIGPGQGDITQHLVDFKKPLLAIEIDPESINLLNRKKLKISICQGDALEISDLERSLFNQFVVIGQGKRKIGLDTIKMPFVLFSSLPYNVGSRILINWAINNPDIPFVVILQKEVVNKINISKKLSVFGLFLNLIFDLKKLFDISNGNFYPIPKVTSALLKGKPKQQLPKFLNTIKKRKIALSVLKKLMAFPNKKLSNNLRNLGWENKKIEEFLAVNNLGDSYRLLESDFVDLLEKIVISESSK